MSASLAVMVIAGAMVGAPIAVALVLIAVDSRTRPRYARSLIGIDDRSSSALRPTHRESPESSMPSATTPKVMTTARVDLGHQALRDAVDWRAGGGAEVFG